MNRIIYMYTSPSGKSYIGQTRYEKRRKENHKYLKFCKAFHAAVEKYGIENFTYKVLHSDVQSDDELNRLEIEEIKNRNTVVPNGYNIRIGGKGGSLTSEHRKKIGDSQRGRKISDELRAKLSIAHKGRHGGKKTQEALESIRKKRYEMIEFKKLNNIPLKKSGYSFKREAKQHIICIDYGIVFPNQSDCAKFFKCTKQAVSFALKNTKILKNFKIDIC